MQLIRGKERKTIGTKIKGINNMVAYYLSSNIIG